MLAPSYYVADGVHVCTTERYYVFLDIRHDRYLSVSKDSMAPLLSVVHGLPDPDPCGTYTTPQTEIACKSVAGELLGAGLISRSPSTSSTLPYELVPSPTRDVLSMSYEHLRQRSDAHPSLDIFRALTVAQYLLSFRTLQHVLTRVQKWRETSPTPTNTIDEERAAALTLGFLRYRPLFPRNYLCMFDSLALLRYLAAKNTYPSWVFGVREAPFAAHCWVQAGHVVLNDYADRAAHYRQIMCI
jgi:Transglutaminase-like superfamily